MIILGCTSRFIARRHRAFGVVTPFRYDKGWKQMLRSNSIRDYSNINDTGNLWMERQVPALGIDFRVSIYNPSFSSNSNSNNTGNDETIPLETVLCLPGALGTGPSDFQNLLEGGLGPKFQVVAMDPRGLGGSSSSVERDYPFNFYLRDALDAAAVMSELGHDSYHVLGWSDGANSAIHLAAHPDTKHSIRRLVVWGGNAYVTKEDCEAWESLRDVQKNWSARMRESKAAIHGGGSIERLQLLNDKATDGWISLYEHPKSCGDVCLQALHQVSCPTLVVHGAKDVVCHIKHARYIARQISNSELFIFPEGKHNVHQRYAEAFNEVVGNFLLDDNILEDDSTSDVPISSKDNGDEPNIDEIAYAFMGSKALFTAIRGGIFDAIHAVVTNGNGSTRRTATFEQVEQGSSIKGERLKTLLSACVALKLIRRSVINGKDEFSLPKASADQLVKTSKRYWGDYISGQVDAQFYSRMKDLDETMRTGNTATSGYEAWFESDPEAAKRYTEAQHNGSLATAYALLKRMPDLADRYPNLRMLDVGGGSGAFSIATARKIPGAECVVLDLPNVTKVANEIISKESDASVRQRLTTLSLSATAPGEWKGIVPDESFDVVLMSYVSGSIPAVALAGLYQNAYRVLKPGGMAIIHDFFVDNNGLGPKNAALWALAHVSVNPDGMGLRPNRIVHLLTTAGFVAPKVDDLIPGATQLIVATKPGN